MRERSKIQSVLTKYVVAVYSRGVIFYEFQKLSGAEGCFRMFPNLKEDDYAIYTREEWEIHGV